MKYTIEGFSQEYAVSLKKVIDGKEVKIDCTDLVILRWFVDFYPKMKKIEVDGQQFALVVHKKLLEDLPLIDISKRAFSERLQKLVAFEILSYKLIKEGGTFAVYGFGRNYECMVGTSNDIGTAFEQHRVLRSNDIGYCAETTYKDTSIKDNSIKDTSIKIERENAEDGNPTPKRFKKPSIEEIAAYCEERKNGINAQRFYDFYESKGWKVGNQPMKDWKACVRTWEQRDRQTGRPPKGADSDKYSRTDDD